MVYRLPEHPAVIAAVHSQRQILAAAAPEERAIADTDAALAHLTELVVLGLPAEPDPAALKLVVRWLAGRLERKAPGRTVEVRVPPIVAVQIGGPDGEGPRHTRGTPPNIIEMDPLTWVELATGRLAWAQARADHRVSASGRLADLTFALPLLT